MNLRKLICISLISFFSCCVNATNYYGVLRGDEIIQYKSPYNGIISLHVENAGDIGENRLLFTVDSFEINAKIGTIRLKLNRYRNKLKRAKQSYVNFKNSYNDGFISHNELLDKQDAVSEVEVNIKELETELNTLEMLKELGNVEYKDSFIIRDISVTNHQPVNTGDSILKIESLKNYYIDIKFDPVQIKHKLLNEIVNLVSLVNGYKLKGRVVKISNAPSDNNVGIRGLKTASIILEKGDEDITSLIDTAFEVTIDDKPDN